MTRHEIFPPDDEILVRPAPVVRRFFVAGVLCTIVADETPAPRRSPDRSRVGLSPKRGGDGP